MVEAGQLRKWRHFKEPWMPSGIFMVIQIDYRLSEDNFWLVLKSSGRTKHFSEKQIAESSEVISESR